MRLRHKQLGISGNAIIAILAVLGFSLWIFFVLFPLYMDNLAVDNAMGTLERTLTQEKNKRTTRHVQNILAKQLYVAGSKVQINTPEEFRSVVKVERNPFKVTVTYNQEAHLVHNLHALVRYENTIEITD